MTTSYLRIFCLGLLMTLGLGMNVFAQNQGSPPPPMFRQMAGINPQMAEQSMAIWQARRAEHRAKRLQDLKTFLQLQSNQESAWSAFFAAVQNPISRPMPTNPDELEKLSTPERIDKMMAIKKARDEQINTRMDATKTFYATLNPQQQKVFDVFSSNAKKHNLMGPDHRGGPMNMRP